jgi:minor histocompatibility antigen H13
LVPAAIPNIPFHLHFTQGGPDGDDDLINYRFSSHDVVCLVCCSIVGAWYIIKKVSWYFIFVESDLVISFL